MSVGWIALGASPSASPGATPGALALRQRLLDVQYFGTACIGRACELQAIMVLRASEALLARNRALLRANAALLHGLVERNADLLSYVRPTAGAVAYLRFKGPLRSEELGEALAAAGIGVKPAYCFTDVVTPDIDGFRIGFGEADTPRKLDALESFLGNHREEWRRQADARLGRRQGDGTARSRL